jgi:alkylation response protein AidB-like acyl-CoA dehydrogenase
MYVPKMVRCDWTGTMNLTEPHCGTDLGLMRTRAEPQADGSYKITGQKIFISAGDHDMAENIVHLVLAKAPGGGEGTKGISLFIVPKVLVNADGSLGARNAVSVGKVEEKMGIHGNATCVMNYDGATGWLLGDLHKGMKAMFTMMNEARLAWPAGLCRGRGRLSERGRLCERPAAGPRCDRARRTRPAPPTR